MRPAQRLDEAIGDVFAGRLFARTPSIGGLECPTCPGLECFKAGVHRSHCWILRSAGLSDAEARRVLRTEGGMCLLDRVRVDVREFLSAERAGNRAWAADRHAEAIGAFQQARSLYVGPLLQGQEAGHPWLTERVDGGLTLVESYHSLWRALSRTTGHPV